MLVIEGSDMAWGVAEAKAKFSEMLDKAETSGPQVVTRRKREFVVMTKREWDTRRLDPNRVLFMGLYVAHHYGSLAARAKKNGYTPNAVDALIAATAVANGMTIATLNRKDFEPLGVELVEC